jgi:hypothetical protein
MITKKELLTQLEALKIFPKNKLVRELQKQIKLKITKLDTKTRPKKTKSKESTNQSRSVKLQRYHRYIRQIQNNFPNLSYKQIRIQLSRRKKGQDVSIPDVIWQNPSP